MKNKILASLAFVGVMSFAGATAQAAIIGLFDYGYNIDGTVSVPTLGDPVPAGINEAGFDTATGLGTISVSISGAGAHSFDFFLDLEIDEATNTFFNEFGAANGVLAAGQSWEIDEPGFSFGDIFINFQASTLDNTNAVTAGSPEDVSLALGWDFTLGAGQLAQIDLLVSLTAPTSGFYLSHTDPDSAATVYLSSALTIRSTGVPVPEPGTLVVFAIGLVGLGLLRRRQVRCAA